MDGLKYKLAQGARVREEDFGLLFYKMHGPRLYFLASGDLLQEEFFQGHVSLETWIDLSHPPSNHKTTYIRGLSKSLKILADKGVIIEC